MPEWSINVADSATPAAPGYDQPWYRWLPLPARPPIPWPGGARTAVSLVLRMGAVEWKAASAPRPEPLGGRGFAPAPDIPRISHREFGHRVGIFRLLSIFADLSIVPAVVLDVATAECYPSLLDKLLPSVSEVIAGGLSESRPITSEMSEDEEWDYIDATMDRLQAAVGARSEGWFSPSCSESTRTPGLLAQAGLKYVTDWGDDEAPFPMDGTGGSLWAFPVSWELSDVSSMFVRLVDAKTWANSLSDAFDVMHAEGGRVLCVHLEPWVSGQAFRAEAVESALAHLRAAKGVWFASPGQIVDHCRALP